MERRTTARMGNHSDKCRLSFSPHMEALEDRTLLAVDAIIDPPGVVDGLDEISDTPPNASGAISSDTVVTTVVDQIQIFSSDGTATIDGDLLDFFTDQSSGANAFGQDGGTYFDPDPLSPNPAILGINTNPFRFEVKTLFDTTSSRFFVVSTQSNRDFTGAGYTTGDPRTYFYIAVSGNSSPSTIDNSTTGDWELFQFTFNPSDFALPDGYYAVLTGVSITQGNVVLTANIHDADNGEAFINTFVWSVPKASLLSSTPITAQTPYTGFATTNYWLLPSVFMPEAGGNTVYLVGLNVDSTGNVQTASAGSNFAVIYQFNASNITADPVLLSGGTIAIDGDDPFGEPIDISGGTTPDILLDTSINTATRRAGDVVGAGTNTVVFDGSFIWAAHTVRDTTTGQDTIRWYQFSLSGGILQSGAVDGPDGSDAFYAAMVTSSSNMALTFSANPDSLIGVWYTGRLSTDDAGETDDPLALIEGTANYTGALGTSNAFEQNPLASWGRWTGIARVPNSNSQVFIYGPYSDGDWATAWGIFAFESVGPIPPSSAGVVLPPLEISNVTVAQEEAPIYEGFTIPGSSYGILAIDISSSERYYNWQDVNYDGVINQDDDLNGDGFNGDLIDYTIGLLERTLAEGLLPQNLSIVVFAKTAGILDMSAASGLQLFANTTADTDGNGVADFLDVLRSLRVGEAGYFNTVVVDKNRTFYNNALLGISEVFTTAVGQGIDSTSIQAAVYSSGSGRSSTTGNPSTSDMPSITDFVVIGPYPYLGPAAILSDYMGYVSGAQGLPTYGGLFFMGEGTSTGLLPYNNIPTTAYNGGFPNPQLLLDPNTGMTISPYTDPIPGGPFGPNTYPPPFSHTTNVTRLSLLPGTNTDGGLVSAATLTTDPEEIDDVIEDVEEEIDETDIVSDIVEELDDSVTEDDLVDDEVVDEVFEELGTEVT